MQKIQVTVIGGPEQMVLIRGADRDPGSHEIRVAVELAGINYVDVYHRIGLYPLPEPFDLGYEGIGTINAVGDGVTDFAVGDRVVWINALGSYATELVLPADRAMKLPADAAAAQGLLFQAVTAHYLLHDYGEIPPGAQALVHAAAGGVGQLLVQWLKHKGARVIGTVSNADKERTVLRLGADAVVNYAEQDFAAAALDLTDGRGLDFVFDPVGRDTLDRSMAILAPHGTAICFGSASGVAPRIDPSLLIVKSLRLVGGAIFNHIMAPGEFQARARAVFAGLDAGWLSIGEPTLFPLADAVAAHRAIEGRSTQGKLALVP